jgi:hypothetical protein
MRAFVSSSELFFFFFFFFASVSCDHESSRGLDRVASEPRSIWLLGGATEPFADRGRFVFPAHGEWDV